MRLLLAGFHALWQTPAILDNELWFPVSRISGTCFVLGNCIGVKRALAIYNLSVFAVKVNVSVRHRG